MLSRKTLFAFMILLFCSTISFTDVVWKPHGLEGKRVDSILIDRANPDVLYAYTNEGVFKSTNSGRTWIEKNKGLILELFMGKKARLISNPGNPQILYLLEEQPPFLLFMSDDGAETWQGFIIPEKASGLNSPNPKAIAIAPSNPNFLYLFSIESHHDHGFVYVFKSTDRGKSWEETFSGDTMIYDLITIDTEGKVQKVTDIHTQVGEVTSKSVSLSPDGNRFAFTDEQDMNQRIYTINADGTALTLLVDKAGNYTGTAVSWSPDGKWIAFPWFKWDNPGGSGLYIIKPDGTGERMLTECGTPSYDPVLIAWSPDSQKIAFTEAPDGCDIYVVDAGGGNRIKLTNDVLRRSSIEQICWSPDGKKIAFVVIELAEPEAGLPPATSINKLYVVDTDGKNEKKIAIFARSPSWSPDGQEITYFRYANGQEDIYTANANGEGERRLTNDPEYKSQAIWSPGGDLIAFFQDNTEEGKSTLCIMDANGENRRKIADIIWAQNFRSMMETIASFVGLLCWSPDEKRLALSVMRSGIWREDVASAFMRYSSMSAIVHPSNHKVLYTTGSYVRKSTDGGISWESLRLGQEFLSKATSIAIAESKPNILYVSAIQIHWDEQAQQAKTIYKLYKTIDGGSSWKPVGDDFLNTEVNCILIDPVNPDIVYIGTVGQGILTTMDGGDIWQEINMGLGDLNVLSLDIDRKRPGSLYAGTANGVFATVNVAMTTWGYLKHSVLFQNYPNPFNPDTWIPYQLAEDSEVTIRIYSVTGQMIKLLDLGHIEAGSYISKGAAAYWDGTTDAGERVSSGVYFYSIQAGGYSATKKMIVVQ